MRLLARLGIALVIVASILAWSLDTKVVGRGAEDQAYVGVIEMTTCESGLLTYITVKTRPQDPVAAGFALQHAEGADHPRSLRGTGRLTATHTGLTIETAQSNLAFSFPSDPGAPGPGPHPAAIIGIAAYDYGHGAVGPRPASHVEFERSVGHLDGPPVCDYAECICGGAGTQSCNCEGRSVSCYSPYEAWCKTNTAICCKPAAPDAPEGIPEKVR